MLVLIETVLALVIDLVWIFNHETHGIHETRGLISEATARRAVVEDLPPCGPQS